MGLRAGQINNGSFKKGMTSHAKGKYGDESPFWKGGKPTCIDCGKQLKTYSAKRCLSCNGKSLVTKTMMKKRGLKGLIKQQNSKEHTSIERLVYDFLVLKGIVFEKQKVINGRFIVDAYIPELNLVIEADGSYWHSLPRVVKKDKAENAYLKKCGFNLIRLTEEEIIKGTFKERMVK